MNEKSGIGSPAGKVIKLVQSFNSKNFIKCSALRSAQISSVKITGPLIIKLRATFAIAISEKVSNNSFHGFFM